MFWIQLAIVLALWILLFGFGIGGWFIPAISAAVWFFYLIRLRREV